MDFTLLDRRDARSMAGDVGKTKTRTSIEEEEMSWWQGRLGQFRLIIWPLECLRIYLGEGICSHW